MAEREPNENANGFKGEPYVSPGQQMPVPCVPQETSIHNVRLAHAYVPFQKMCSIFKPSEGLCMGTIFPELFSPYEKEDIQDKKVCESD